MMNRRIKPTEQEQFEKNKSSKRVREVWSAGMVAHLWANQLQYTARAGNRANFFFRGNTIYSYGEHFPIARVVKRKGKTVVLFTTRTYSHTTAGHCCCVRGACQHMTVFNVYDVNSSNHKEGLDDYRKRIQQAMEGVDKARSAKPAKVEQLKALIAEANAFSQFFGLRSRIKIDCTKLDQECKRFRKQADEKKRRELQKIKKQQDEMLAKWVSGESDHPPMYTENVCLRVVGDELQTSLGARIPLNHAKKAFKFIKACHNKHTTYARNGKTIHLGLFAIDTIDEAGNVKAGCHTVEWNEIERIAQQVGVA